MKTGEGLVPSASRSVKANGVGFKQIKITAGGALPACTLGYVI
jgi:hypothetical protein